MVEAVRVFRLVEAKYPTGITIDDLKYDLRVHGVRIASDNQTTALRSALNDSQKEGTWRSVDTVMWLPGDGVSKTETGLSGKALADALYDFVRDRAHVLTSQPQDGDDPLDDPRVRDLDRHPLLSAGSFDLCADDRPVNWPPWRTWHPRPTS